MENTGNAENSKSSFLFSSSNPKKWKTPKPLPVHPYLQSNENSISNIFDTSKYGILQIKNGLADAPQMGWNSWNFFACNINETIIKETADALISTGLAKLGYIHVNIGGSSSGNSRAGDKILSTLLTEMDGLEESKGVLVLAATNLVDAIYPTLRCPGQFDEASI